MRPIAPLLLLALHLGAGGVSATATLGPARRVNGDDAECQNHPLVAPLRSGGFAVAWDHYGGDDPGVHLRLADAQGRLPGPATLFRGRLLGVLLADTPGGLMAIWGAVQGAGTWMQRLSASGQPLGEEVSLPIAAPPRLLAAARAADGRFAVVWPSGEAVKGRWFSAEGLPLGPEIDVGRSQVELPVRQVAAAIDSEGRLVAAWIHQEQPGPAVASTVRFRRFDAEGNAAGPAVDVSADVLGPVFERAPALAAMRDGAVVVAWERWWFGEKSAVWFRRFDAADRPLEKPAEVAPGAVGATPTFVSDGGGRLALSWWGPETGAVRLFDTAGPPGPELPLHVEVFEGNIAYQSPALAFLANGRLAVAWNTYNYAGTFATPCDNEGIFERVVDLAPADRTGILRLGGGRFLAEVVWRTPDGASGTGKARALADDTGAFWFFWEDNLELMVKVLDGRGLNGAFWVFYASLTDVAFDLTVTDLETGAQKVYSKPQGRMESHADTEAFP